MRTTILIAIIISPIALFSQVEIPISADSCKQFTKGKFSYCLDKNYNAVWTALQIKGTDIENKVYIPSDKEFFKNIPEESAYVLEKTEIQSKLWAMHFDSIYVVTGKKDYYIDSIPKTAYYKAILKGCQGDGLGFWIEPGKSSTNIADYSITLDKLEQKTNMDFFPILDRDLQSIFEAEFSWDFWPLLVD